MNQPSMEYRYSDISRLSCMLLCAQLVQWLDVPRCSPPPDLIPTSPLHAVFKAWFAGCVVYMEWRAGLASVRRGQCLVVVHMHLVLERHRCNDACGRPRSSLVRTDSTPNEYRSVAPPCAPHDDPAVEPTRATKPITHACSRVCLHDCVEDLHRTLAQLASAHPPLFCVERFGIHSASGRHRSTAWPVAGCDGASKAIREALRPLDPGRYVPCAGAL